MAGTLAVLVQGPGCLLYLTGFTGVRGCEFMCFRGMGGSLGSPCF